MIEQGRFALHSVTTELGTDSVPKRILSRVILLLQIFYYYYYFNSELQPFHSLIFTHSKFQLIPNQVCYPHSPYSQPQGSRGMEGWSHLIEEWRCMMHIAASSAPHRTRLWEARAQHLLTGASDYFTVILPQPLSKRLRKPNTNAA